MNNNKNFRIMKFFEAADKSCEGKGYVKIDMRGNRGSITVNVENLSDGKVPSEVYLFKNKNEKIKIGPINTKRGRLQRNLVLNGKDEPIENYNICGVVVNDKILMYTPIFTEAQVKQLSALLDMEELLEEKPMQCEDELLDDLNDTVVESNATNSANAHQSQNNTGNNYNYYQSVKAPRPENNQNNQNEQVNEENSDNNNNEEVQVEQNARKYNNEYERKLFTLLNEFDPIRPLAHDIKSMNWWKIIYDENSIYKGFLPYFNQIITTYYPYPLSNHVTTCQILMQRHGYYLFGMYEENGRISKYVYGVPGKFTRDEQPYRGVTGFKNWSYKSNDIPGDYGYWLAFIDANTGAVSEAPEVE